MNDDFEIFKNKKMSDLLEQIYTNQKTTSAQIGSLINQLSDMITTTEQAILLVPALAGYLAMGIKNDQILIRLTTSITKLMETKLKQRFLQQGGGSPELISQSQYQQLLKLSQSQQKTKIIDAQFEQIIQKAQEKIGIKENQ